MTKKEREELEATKLALARTQAELNDTVIKLRQQIARSNQLARRLSYAEPKPDESPTFKAACMEYQAAHPGERYTFAQVRHWLAAGKPARV